MCVPAPQLLMISTMATAVGSISAGNAQARAYQRSATSEVEQMQADKEVAELEAMTAETERMLTFQEAVASNATAMSFMGRDVNDPSALALFQKNWDNTQSDITNIKLQHRLNNQKRDRMMQTTLDSASERATASQRSGQLNAIVAGTTGIRQIKGIE